MINMALPVVPYKQQAVTAIRWLRGLILQPKGEVNVPQQLPVGTDRIE